MTHTPVWVEEIGPPPVEWLIRQVTRRQGAIVFDSALPHSRQGRYSYFAAEPFARFEFCPPAGSSAETHRRARLFWQDVRRAVGYFRSETIPCLPPFQGGLAGVLSYEFGQAFEVVPTAQRDEFALPRCTLGMYDCLLALDHVENRAWIVSQGFPETEPTSRARRARDRAEQLKAWLIDGDELPRAVLDGSLSAARGSWSQDAQQTESEGFRSNFTQADYIQAVHRALDYIRTGDVFQVNLAQRLAAAACFSDTEIYLRLRAANPAPFAGYFDTGRCRVLSSSPELFLRVRERHVETRPIKGTRPRYGDARCDEQAERELLDSEKDQAENVMIVDLLRNDLSRVCEPDSVRVSELYSLERYAAVIHLVSAVTGTLRRECDAFDLLAVAFPGGSITGTPKVRAMEVIAELEPDTRGPYCGSMGYIGFDGNALWNILIRTITSVDGWWLLPVGGGIVAQSDPEAEYHETLVKAKAMLDALL